MDYLTVYEFKELTNKQDISGATFENYLPKAQAILDNVTRSFYQFTDLEEDIPFRARKFKEALCAQVLYFMEMDSDTYEGINKAPQSFTVGRTSISNGSRYNASGENETKNLLCEDVYLYLEGTGLLWRGC